MLKNFRRWNKSRTNLNRHCLVFITIIVLSLITGCSQEATNNLLKSCSDDSDGVKLCLELLDINNVSVRNLELNKTATVVATLTNSGGSTAGEVIDFETDLGTLASNSGLTDGNGKATVSFVSGNSPSVGKLTARATIAGASIFVKFGFAVDGTVDPGTGGDGGGGGGGGGTTPIVSQSSNGAISFLSANPQQITLKSTGGFGLTELSTLTFKLIGIDGLPISNQKIDFTINNNIGGIIIEPTSAVSGFDGIVSTVVRAGTVPTSVRITATTTLTDNGTDNIIVTQSDMLSIGVGTPDQNSMSLSVDNFAPEAWNYDGINVNVSIRLADQFNNPVADGTSVYFTTEGGSIEPSCETAGGTCIVKWMSQNPRPSDHRVTILATTLGSESFTDTDSDGIYSLADGEPFTDVNGNGVFDEAFTETIINGRFDEPFLGGVPNGLYDLGEEDIGYDSLNGIYDFGETFTDIGDGKYNEGEDFVDAGALNGVWDPGEAYTDAGNKVWDVGEDFVDAVNGKWDPGEPYTDAPNNTYELGDLFVDYNGNGVFDGIGNNPTGETVFLDSNNGNGLFDGSGYLPAGEFLAGKDINSNGLFDGPGFADLGEPYLDSNENNKRDVDEYYVDTNNDGSFTADGDGKFNGLLCDASSNICAAEKTLRIRESMTFIMASSALQMVARKSTQNTIYYSSVPGISPNAVPSYIDARVTSVGIRIFYSDTAGQSPPEGTTVSVTSSTGQIDGAPKILRTAIFSIPPQGTLSGEDKFNTLNSFSFSISDTEKEEEEWGVIYIIFTTPKGVSTSYALSVRT